MFAILYSRELIQNSGITELSTRVILGIYSDYSLTCFMRQVG